jgi:predicted  nucleic acid-binding Zn-ribbon protein
MRVTLDKVDKKIDLLIQETNHIRTELAEQKATVTGITSTLQACTIEIALIKQAQAGHKLNFSRGWDLMHWLLTAVFGGYLFFKN